jgi:hypothetical protein
MQDGRPRVGGYPPPYREVLPPDAVSSSCLDLGPAAGRLQRLTHVSSRTLGIDEASARRRSALTHHRSARSARDCRAVPLAETSA